MAFGLDLEVGLNSKSESKKKEWRGQRILRSCGLGGFSQNVKRVLDHLVGVTPNSPPYLSHSLLPRIQSISKFS